MECLICFQNDLKLIKCSYKKCSDGICGECVTAMIKCYVNELEIPTCPVTSCPGEYLYSNLQSFVDKETLLDYEKICASKIETFGSENQELKIKEKLVKFLRDKKLKEIQTFPPAITKIINIALDQKLKAISKDNKKAITKILSKKKSVPTFIAMDLLYLLTESLRAVYAVMIFA